MCGECNWENNPPMVIKTKGIRVDKKGHLVRDKRFKEIYIRLEKEEEKKEKLLNQI